MASETTDQVDTSMKSVKKSAGPNALRRFAQVGAGAAGSQIFRHLLAQGLEARWLCDTSVQGNIDSIPIQQEPGAPADIDLLVLALPDGAIRAVAEELAHRWKREDGSKEENSPRKIVVHLSAATPLVALEPLRELGWEPALMHPMQTFPRSGELEGGHSVPFWALQGKPETLDLLEPLFVGSEVLRLEAGQEIPYHLCGVLASNFLPALLGLTEAYWPGDREQMLRALLPIMQRTMANLEAGGLSAAISGPLARGDEETLARHQQWIQQNAPDDRVVTERLNAELKRLLAERESNQTGEMP